METENKIIRLMLEEKKEFTIREISKKINADYKITYTAAQRLIKKNIILYKTVGRSSLCKLNYNYYGIEIYQAEEERKNKLLKNTNLNQLYKEVMTKVNTYFFIFLVFGSYAKHKQTKSSDIDLMFISNENGFENKIHNIMSLLPLKTHSFIFTEKEFKKMLDSKELNVVKEAVNNNIILYGTENYYRLLENAK